MACPEASKLRADYVVDGTTFETNLRLGAETLRHKCSDKVNDASIHLEIGSAAVLQDDSELKQRQFWIQRGPPTWRELVQNRRVSGRLTASESQAYAELNLTPSANGAE